MYGPTCIFWANLTSFSLKHIFDECIRGLLLADGTKTVVMATHQLHTVRAMDTVLLLERGAAVAQGVVFRAWVVIRCVPPGGV